MFHYETRNEYEKPRDWLVQKRMTVETAKGQKTEWVTMAYGPDRDEAEKLRINGYGGGADTRTVNRKELAP